MRVGSRIRKRKNILNQKKRVVTLGVGTFILLSGTSMVTINIVDRLMGSLEDKSVTSIDVESDMPAYKDTVESDIAKAREMIAAKWYGDTAIKEVDSEKGVTDFMILVNKTNTVSKDYVPNDLVVPKIRFNGDVANKYVVSEVATALEDMFTDAKKENIVLLGVSGYRSYAYQDNLYKNKVKTKGKAYANKYVALAGASEHQLGLAMDLVSTEYTTLDKGFANTKAYKWLEENMQDYGFILRYTEGKEDITGYAFEPWHIRYVGIEAAKDIKAKGVTLEEYLGR